MQKSITEALDFTTQRIKDLKFASGYKLHAYSVAIFCSLIELAEAYHVMMQSKARTGSLSVFRTFLENHVDLVNLSNDENYVDQLDFDNHKQNIKNLKAAKDGNKFLYTIAKYADEKVPEYESENRKLKADKNFKIVHHISDKFSLAGMEDIYRGVYPMLCSESHSSLQALIARHFDIKDDEQNFEVVLFNDKERDMDLFIAVSLVDRLYFSGELVSKIIQSPLEKDFASKREEFVKFSQTP